MQSLAVVAFDAMPFISVTRLHLRSWRFVPAFIAYTLASARQVKRADGFRSGYLAGDAERGSWTVTVWRDETAMRSFRASGAHLKAMPRLLRWCDEASVAHWTEDTEAAPTPQVAFTRLHSQGRISKVHFPSDRQARGETAGSAPPKIGLRLRS